jgi:hypothetical protein
MRSIKLKLLGGAVAALLSGVTISQVLAVSGANPSSYGTCANPGQPQRGKECKIQETACVSGTVGACQNSAINCPGNGPANPRSGRILEMKAWGACTDKEGQQCVQCGTFYCVKGRVYELRDCDGSSCDLAYGKAACSPP